VTSGRPLRSYTFVNSVPAGAIENGRLRFPAASRPDQGPVSEMNHGA
jgi:hypothetical protein